MKLQCFILIVVTSVVLTIVGLLFVFDFDENIISIEVLPLPTRQFQRNVVAIQKQYFPNDTINFTAETRLNASVNSNRESEKPFSLLTLFTSFKNNPDKKQVHKNVLMNWVVYKPYIIPLLFDCDTDKELVNMAKELGWDVLKAPLRNKQGTPYLKNMYKKAISTYSSVFYGYSNGDILYDYGLLNTLYTIIAANDTLKNPLVVGQRSNFELKNRSIFKPEDVKRLGKKESKIFRPDAEDYFIMMAGDFPWTRVPDVVVGRPGYDNFIVGTAILSRKPVVDATKTILALHQSGKDGNFAGHSKKNKDRLHNYHVIKKFNYAIGSTSKAQFHTKLSNIDTIQVWHRKERAAPKEFQVRVNLVMMHNITSTFMLESELEVTGNSTAKISNSSMSHV